MVAYEKVIRDALCANLDVLEEGLVLLKKEKLLESELGTRGFVDIWARDKNGRHVLIELKRSNSSCREAAHEVLKYVEGLKQSLAATESELRVFVVSTHWDELLVPFSSLVKRSKLYIKGFLLDVDKTGVPISSVEVPPIDITEGRLFAPWHELTLFASNSDAEKYADAYVELCVQKEIRDYVVVVMSAPPGHHEKVVNLRHAALCDLLSSHGGVPPPISEVEAKIKRCDHLVYFAMKQLDLDSCCEKVRKLLKSQEEVEEFESSLDEMIGEDKLNVAHNALLNLGEMPHCEQFEIAYPAKFIKLVEQDGWQVQSLRRFGAIQSNKLLSDEAIFSELKGEQGVTRQRYRKQLEKSELHLVESAFAEAQKCLEDNSAWRLQFHGILYDVMALTSLEKLKISVYNPSNILLSIFFLLARDDGILYWPSFSIEAVMRDSTVVYMGVLVPSAVKPSLGNIVDVHFGGSLERLVSNLGWGGYNKDDAGVVRASGWRYRTLKVVADKEGRPRNFFMLEDAAFESCAPFSLVDNFDRYMETNRTFVNDVFEFYSGCWDGAMVDLNSATNYRPKT